MQVLTAKYEYSDDILKITLHGEIDHHSAKAAREEIDLKILEYRAKTVLIDLQGVGFMDSSGLGLILGRYTHAKEAGSVLKVINPSPGAEKVLRMAGTDKIIPIIHRKNN